MNKLSRGFLRWIEALRKYLRVEVVAIDGKTARRSFDRQAGKSALCTVSAWAVGHRQVLAQVAVEENANEIRAIRLRRLAGCPGSLIWRNARESEADHSPRMSNAFTWLFKKPDIPCAWSYKVATSRRLSLPAPRRSC